MINRSMSRALRYFGGATTKHAVRRLCIPVAGILILLSGIPARAEQPLRLATPGAGEFLWIMGKELTTLWGRAGVPSEVTETAGDRQSLERLVSKEADLALVSGFALADFMRRHTGAPIVTVASCWKSALNVVLNEKYAATGTLADLDGRKLYLAPEGTADGDAERRILEVLGIRLGRFAPKTSETGLLAAMSDFRLRPLDGAIIVGSVPDPMVRDIIDANGGMMHLLGSNERAVSALAAAGLPVFLMKIPAETYPFQRDVLSVIATGTYLVSRPDLPGGTAAKLRDTVFANAAAIAAYFPQGGTLVAGEAAIHLIAPLHPALR